MFDLAPLRKAIAAFIAKGDRGDLSFSIYRFLFTRLNKFNPVETIRQRFILIRDEARIAWVLSESGVMINILINGQSVPIGRPVSQEFMDKYYDPSRDDFVNHLEGVR